VRILVLYNPIAGAGRAAEAAEGLVRRLRGAGHDAAGHATVASPGPGWLEDELADRELVVVVGGDGAVRLAAGPARRTNTPIYQYPFGTENLFAREFGMSRSADRLLAALEHGRARRVDLARADGEWFVLMASVGYDAEVVHDLAAHRRGSISQLSYLPPILRQMRRWRSPLLTVRVDGRTVVDGRHGVVVVANCRQYAHRLDPAWRASMVDGRLDVVLLPAETALGLLPWVARCRTRRQERHPRSVYAEGRRVEIETDRPCRYQLDGDPPGRSSEPIRRLTVEIAPEALSVLAPDERLLGPARAEREVAPGG
jgi:diacylglycerol kinase family enzyme